MKSEIKHDGQDIFLIVNGKKIAMRGKPGSIQAGTWIPLDTGYRISERNGNIEVEHLDNEEKPN